MEWTSLNDLREKFLKFFESKGYKKNIVVLTQESSYRKKPQKGIFLIRYFLRKYPALIQKLASRHLAYNAALDYIHQQAANGSVLLIQPEKPLPVDRLCHDPALLQATYDAGKSVAEKLLPQIRLFLQK